jgi:hypothetical protein
MMFVVVSDFFLACPLCTRTVRMVFECKVAPRRSAISSYVTEAALRCMASQNLGIEGIGRAYEAMEVSGGTEPSKRLACDRIRRSLSSSVFLASRSTSLRAEQLLLLYCSPPRSDTQTL